VILAAKEILYQVNRGGIVIEPFDGRPTAQGGQLGPNSYDVRLGDKLLYVKCGSSDGWALDFKEPYETEEVKKNRKGGWTLHPGMRYLGVVKERIATPRHVPWIDGRSTVGRYFLMIHITAGRGDIGWDGHFTLEMVVMGNGPDPHLPRHEDRAGEFLQGDGVPAGVQLRRRVLRSEVRAAPGAAQQHLRVK
jgi:dCTP deaminase